MSGKSELREIPLDQLCVGPYQTRRVFSEENLQELAESIKSVGLIQPLVIRPITLNRYEIIAGERRWRAAAYVGLNTVPCLVRDIPDEQTAAVTTIENIQREDLNPIEEAQAYSRLIAEFQYHHEELAIIVGKSRTQITNVLRLLKLDLRVQELLINKQLSEGHGKIIAGVAPQYQYELAKKCFEQDWSVRKLEQEIKRVSTAKQTMQSNKDPDIARLEKLFSEQLAAPVELESDISKQGGWIKIRYFDNETLAGLLQKMKIDD